MGTLFLSVFLGVRTGAEDLFIDEAAGMPKTVTPGRPSVPTMINFMLIALAGIITMLHPEKLRAKLKFIGLIVCLIGTVAVAGYIINSPILYYFIPGMNSAMAFHTALLFVLLGIGFACL